MSLTKFIPISGFKSYGAICTPTGAICTPKLNLLTVAGALPDLIDTADISLVAIHDKLIDLDDFLNQLPEIKAQYYPSLLQSCQYKGSLKMIPFYYNVPFIYYRPDLFRKAGLPEPSPDWTWDDYRHDAKMLTERNPDGAVEIYGTNVQAKWWVEWLSLIRQAGGDALTQDGQLEINSPATLQAVQLMHDLIYVDRSAPKPMDAPPNGFENGENCHLLWRTCLRTRSLAGQRDF